MKTIAEQIPLVEVEPQDSPRLAWIKKYKIIIQNFPNVKTGDEDEFGNEMFQWVAISQLSAGASGEGATENNAIANLAIKLGWKLWNEESYGQQNNPA